MNDIIRLLPDSVANQIAAGEVIQRPASVIKELVENSVDAGASSIDIIIADAGRTLIQVVDNGKGMSETDARMAFERHATSKIAAASDLLTLQTMGFRGEALASIAAVAQIDLRTMQPGAQAGTRIEINGSKVESQEPCACSVGTNMMVKNLFYTVPARRKFLKKDSVEFANIVREFERLALVNPTIDFSLMHNGNIYHQLRHGSMKQRICDLFGKNLDKQLIPVGTDTSIVRIEGFLGLPEYARKRNQLQYLLINGRNMKHPVFHHAILECYQELIGHDQQPNYFISFSVDPETIDVNIHPTKNEIKFENEFAIRQILVAAVKESLGKFSVMPGIDFDTDDAPDIPAFNPSASYNPFEQYNEPERESNAAPSNHQARNEGYVEVEVSLDRNKNSLAGRDWEKLYEDFTRKRDSATPTPGVRTVDIEVDVDTPKLDLGILPDDSSRSYTQILNRYIITPCQQGMMIIDQNRAHIVVLYDRYSKMMQNNRVATQSLIFPEVLELSPALSSLLETMADDMSRLGFDISPLGGNSWNISGVPDVIGDNSPKEIIQSILEDTVATGDSDRAETAAVCMPALAMAKAMAVKVGMHLSDSEIRSIVTDLFSLSAPNYTPDGKLVLTTIDKEELASKFRK